MRGFTSLMALRLFEKSEKYEAKGYKFDKFLEKINVSLSNNSNLSEDELYKLKQKAIDLENDGHYMHLEAAGLRVQADDAELKYINSKKITNKKLIKNK